jgi:hypothetical protein
VQCPQGSEQLEAGTGNVCTIRSLITTHVGNHESVDARVVPSEGLRGIQDRGDLHPAFGELLDDESVVGRVVIHPEDVCPGRRRASGGTGGLGNARDQQPNSRDTGEHQTGRHRSRPPDAAAGRALRSGERRRFGGAQGFEKRAGMREA